MGERTYIYPCSRCGFCCMAEPCPIAIMSGVPRDSGQCPHLEFNGDIASCGLAAKHPEILDAFGFGKGCCMLGQLQTQGRTQSWSAISSVDKYTYVRMIRSGKAGLDYTHERKEIHNG